MVPFFYVLFVRKMVVFMDPRPAFWCKFWFCFPVLDIRCYGECLWDFQFCRYRCLFDSYNDLRHDARSLHSTIRLLAEVEAGYFELGECPSISSTMGKFGMAAFSGIFRSTLDENLLGLQPAQFLEYPPDRLPDRYMGHRFFDCWQQCIICLCPVTKAGQGGFMGHGAHFFCSNRGMGSSRRL